MDGHRHAVTSADGTEIGLLTAGDGPPLLLVHGGMGCIESWQPLWEPLTSRWRVTAMDRRGRGSSGDTQPYELSREFEDVAAVAASLAERRLRRRLRAQLWRGMRAGRGGGRRADTAAGPVRAARAADRAGPVAGPRAAHDRGGPARAGHGQLPDRDHRPVGRGGDRAAGRPARLRRDADRVRHDAQGERGAERRGPIRPGRRGRRSSVLLPSSGSASPAWAHETSP